MTSDKVKELYLLCKEISQSPVLIQQLITDIENSTQSPLLPRLHSLLITLQLADLGLEPSLQGYFLPGHISYTSIHDTAELCICFFALHRGAGIPLHDHPGMVVLSVLLKGKLRFKLADLVGRERENVFAFRQGETGEIKAPGVLALTPAMGNLHQFVAMEDTVMLDVFMPNYSKVRDVSYFLEISDTHLCSFRSTLLNFREIPYNGASLPPDHPGPE